MQEIRLFAVFEPRTGGLRWLQQVRTECVSLQFHPPAIREPLRARAGGSTLRGSALSLAAHPLIATLALLFEPFFLLDLSSSWPERNGAAAHQEGHQSPQSLTPTVCAASLSLSFNSKATSVALTSAVRAMSTGNTSEIASASSISVRMGTLNCWHSSSSRLV